MTIADTEGDTILGLGVGGDAPGTEEDSLGIGEDGTGLGIGVEGPGLGGGALGFREDAHFTAAIGVPIERLVTRAYRIPTEATESDGTLEWNATTLVLVEAHAGGRQGLGYTYASTAAATLIHELLSAVVQGLDALSPPGAWRAMVYSVRNVGRPGIASEAIAAVDSALWDLKAKLLDLPLVTLLGSVRESVPVYWSGGFTSKKDEDVARELKGALESGISRMKIKIGHQQDVPHRVQLARRVIGDEAELFVDANGAYDRKEALAIADSLDKAGVSWFEEPVSSDDVEGLRLLRDRAPAGIEIAAGEYGYDLFHFRRLLENQAVDVLQADATRCAGITGFIQAAVLCAAHTIPLSSHTAPSLHLHPGCALTPVRHLEYFFDHVRIERRLFDGFQEPQDGLLSPDLSRPGLGLEFRHEDARQWEV